MRDRTAIEIGRRLLLVWQFLVLSQTFMLHIMTLIMIRPTLNLAHDHSGFH